ncbi:MAG: hypothetical protein IT462_13000 [Planctomycetes bacterium]|nr:hypothetical protein [Planctomycetota bacterium]
MRDDLDRVIINKPRWNPRDDSSRLRWCDLEDAPAREPINPYNNRKGFTDRLGPLRRWLDAQVGRHWDKVYGDLCGSLDRRKVSADHVFLHAMRWIALNTRKVDGEIVDSAGNPLVGRYRPYDFYVCPLSGMFRRVPVRRESRPKKLTIGNALLYRPVRFRNTIAVRLEDPQERWYRINGAWYFAELVSRWKHEYRDRRKFDEPWNLVEDGVLRLVLGRATVTRLPQALGEDFLEDLHGREGNWVWLANEVRQLKHEEIRDLGLHKRAA